MHMYFNVAIVGVIYWLCLTGVENWSYQMQNMGGGGGSISLGMSSNCSKIY